ncbi:MAG: putative bifunctional diguanylate cyclase/phosphodiesterase [Dehalococcoidia bacterium]
MEQGDRRRADRAARTPDVRGELVRRAALASRAMLLIGPPAALTLALLTHGTTAGQVALFVTLEAATVALALSALTALLRKLREDPAATHVPSVIALTLAAAVWPAAFVVLDPQDQGGHYLALMFCIAAAATSLSATAAYRPFFLALMAGNLAPTTILIVTGSLLPEISPWLAFMSVCFAGALAVSFEQAHRTILEAIGARVVEEGLSEQLYEANARLVHRATHDDLTGLANRALFRDVLERRIQAVHAGSRELALLYLDLDRFKVINDSLGHAEGDALLQAAAERLRGCIRNDDLLARLGGDEFTLVAPDIDVHGALALAERVRAAFDPEFHIAGLRSTVTVSVGVAMSVPDVSALDLMRYADAALYEAKAKGRNTVVLFDHAMTESLSSRLERENELRDALAARQFEAWYQPLVDPRTLRIVSAEALARWRRPGQEVVAPGMFLPLMAEVGLTTELDIEVARQARAFRRVVSRYVGDHFRIFTNVSAGQQPLEAVIGMHLDAAEADRTPLAWMGLEITEQAVVQDPRAAASALGDAREQGLAVVLDDVGTGYSSLSLIRALPLDGLKIDGSFVRGMSTDTADAAVVASVAALGRRLGLHVTAEGVETQAELDAVVGEGVSTIQGYLFSPPVSGEVLLGWLRDGPPWLAIEPLATPLRRTAD